MKLLTPNTMIQGRYLVVQLIGKGGMGEVYLAVDQRLGSAVALKRTNFAEDANFGGGLRTRGEDSGPSAAPGFAKGQRPFYRKRRTVSRDGAYLGRRPVEEA